MSEMRKKAIEGLNVNDTFTVERTFTEQDVMQFADIARDYNPFHLDDRFTAGFVNQKGTKVLEAVLEGILARQEGREVMKTLLAEGDPTNKLYG